MYISKIKVKRGLNLLDYVLGILCVLDMMKGIVDLLGLVFL